MHVEFDYDVGVYIESILSIEALDFCHRLSKLEKMLRPGDIYMSWCPSLSLIVSGLRFLGWSFTPEADFTSHIGVSLYLPSSRLIKFTKGKNIIVLGYMQSAPKTYSLSMTFIAL